MLNIKYIPNFKNNEPYLVITGTAKDFSYAAAFLRQKHPAMLDDIASTRINGTENLAQPLSLTPAECYKLADSFERVISAGRPAHDYLDIKSLPNAEIMVSHMEYDNII